MRQRLRTGLILCTVSYFLIIIYFQSYVVMESSKNFIQRRNAWPVVNNSYKEDTRLHYKPISERVHILIVAYYRSGSTFTGSMFDANKDVFYSFEPLHYLQTGVNGDNITMSYLNGTKMDKSFNLARRETIENVLRCKVSQLDKNVLSTWFWEIPKASRPYRQCVNHSHNLNVDCVKVLQEVCLQKNVTVIKTIRFPMEEVKDMLHKDNSLKVIHLVRDPRATLCSAQRLGEEQAAAVCNDTYNDMLVTKHLLKSHPEKVKLIFYEDITIDTKNVVKDIYDFVGLPFTSEIEEHISQLRAEDNGHCLLCLGRSNATYQMNKWRIEMRFKNVKVIDSKCGKLLDMAGYKPATSEKLLRDLKYPLRESIIL